MESQHLLATIGQYALIRNGEGKLLVLERARSKTWCLPGGRLQASEAWDVALLREIAEETGLECANPRPVDVEVVTDPYQTKYCVYFALDPTSSPDVVLSDEHNAYRWISPQEVPTLPFESEGIRTAAQHLLE
ncbi:MAG: NUDIX domain-containing protein [Patescibacteria group bacterium]|jgi:8-oxo-dGTP diphosphatase